MSIKRVFKCRIPFSSFFLKSGKQLAFIAGRVETDIEDEIKELEAEIKSGHPHLFIDENEKEVDTEQSDPLEAIKKKAIEDYLAQQAASVVKTNDMGSTQQDDKLQGIANSNTVAEGMAGSDSAVSSAAQVTATDSSSGSASAALAALVAAKVS